jgi:hypothetical protein
MVPLVVIVSVPVKEGVGERPMSPPAVPETTVVPVLVIPAPARTANVELVPSGTGVIADEVEMLVKTPMAATATIAIAGTPYLMFFEIGFAPATVGPLEIFGCRIGAYFKTRRPVLSKVEQVLHND